MNKDFRFVCGYDCNDQCHKGRVTVFVYDKVNGHIVYKANPKNNLEAIKREYGYIKTYYGKENCHPPKELAIKLYS